MPHEGLPPALDLYDLPTLNAALNGSAAVLLITGFRLIRRGREPAHKRVMLAAFGCSILFLASYLTFHFQAGRVTFVGGAGARELYLALLLSHTLLAALVPFLALRTIWLGLRGRRRKHRFWARITLPIWLYVSVTGVLIYLILYHWTGSAAAARASG
ncbi:MAG: DUF420 domain-containing protein [Planctomycetota bacterium]